MKKIVRTAAFLCLLTISLASYFFLQVQQYRSNQGQQLADPAIEQVEEVAPDLPAPDVMLVKKVFETARRFVPAGTLTY